MSPIPHAEEAHRLARLFHDRPDQLLTLLSGQLAVLKQQAHALMGLCGLVVTVTGFSGAHMVRAGSTPALLMVLGIAWVLVASVLCLRAMAQVRWVTKELTEDLRETAAAVIARRDQQHAVLSWSAACVACGLACYLAAVAVAALGAQVVPG